jgi:hypothetical protein
MLDFAPMLSLDDKRWSTMLGGYRVPFDPRPLLARLETEQDTTSVWQELWNELHHQGDVGEASFATVPHLVRIHRKRSIVDWNTYALVAMVELARKEGKNPDVPEWMKEDYFRAIRDLAEIGASEVLRTDNAEDVRAILSILAIEKGLRTHGKFLVNYSEDEMLDIESRL